jgi:hypothetical protein
MPRSAGSTEQFLDWVGKKVADRHGSWRNLSRVNVILQLMVAQHASVADLTRYMQILRRHLEANGGATGLKRAADYKRFRDRVGDSSLRRFLAEVNARTAFHTATQSNSTRAAYGQSRVARKGAELVAQGLPPTKLNDHHRRPDGPRAATYHSAKRRKLSDYPAGAEWHPTKNGSLRAEDVSAGSQKRRWWLCPVHPSHEWEREVNARTSRRDRCPFCTNRRLSVTNSLATLRPDLALEWDVERNEGVTPADVMAGANGDAHWICRICGIAGRPGSRPGRSRRPAAPNFRGHPAHEPDLFDVDWQPEALEAPIASVEDPDLPF